MSQPKLNKPAAFDSALPLDRARTIPSEWYTSARSWKLERECVFGSQWLVAGRAEQVAAPGSFVTVEIAGEPLLIARDADGVLRAFFNVCRHRAAKVAVEPCGTASRFRCRYHGWTYDLSGRLSGVPEFAGVAGFCREEHGLVEVAAQTWGPLLFVHLGEPATSLDDFLEPLPREILPFRIESLRFHERRVYELACNWKVFVDNYLDGGYHVNTLHKSLAGVLNYSAYRTEVYEYSSVQSAPLRPAEGDRAAATRVRKGESAAYWWVYPNFMINAYDGLMDTNLVLPAGARRCRVVFDYYFSPGTAAAFAAESIALADRIQAEDAEICAEVQRGLASRSFESGRYSVRRERGVYHFHRLLAKDLSSGD